MFTFLMENGWNGDTPHSLSRNTPFYNVVTRSKVISVMSQKTILPDLVSCVKSPVLKS